MSRHRLFVALRPPEDVADTLLDTMEGLPGARWQDADNLHLTLRFIGEVDRAQFEDICTVLSRLHFDPFEVRLAGVGHFERKGRARAIWARGEASLDLLALQERVERACRRAGCPPETRKFVPHVTLARLNSGSAPVGPWLAAHGDLAPRTWRADHVSLFESDLTPNGAVYEELHKFP
ncbi:RNA 2',3'-cyclic phosphodiesterase [Aurantiacibacter spongiae]|uniref:RNA 2',3'-cyclic phosphodiesterase n=1 Tax=Aurantiacibacter spongiae TaxID=2488860 RepID=A0A3N5D7Y8_9SPHN|nr:RNA 2',3'-cyclic phosphodiesterase [Aurantiacibacter spongiae]RPF70688.1 RNA 2',3'-cyclic phosphodiesterase [Aurantiacibacter spongiae]